MPLIPIEAELIGLQVDIEQRDIDHGIQHDCEKCPTALAVLRALKARFPAFIFLVEVNDEFLQISVGPEMIYDRPTDKLVSALVYQFDHGWNVKPLTFKL